MDYEKIKVIDKRGKEYTILKTGKIYIQLENGNVYIYTSMPKDNGDGLGYGQAYDIFKSE